MKHYRFSFQWFNPDKMPTTCQEFSIFSYNKYNAMERAIEKIKEADLSKDIEKQIETKECVVTYYEVQDEPL